MSAPEVIDGILIGGLVYVGFIILANLIINWDWIAGKVTLKTNTEEETASQDAVEKEEKP